ncbi:MAG: hypothetical protein OXT73_05245 [Bacteroidota bacterium]|nr:hypothetical protein [Bacteroidota bacterium]
MPSSSTKRSSGTTLGWVLWRGGLWFCGLYIGWQGTVRTWRFLLSLELPDPLFIGLVLMLAGSILVVTTLIVERIHDAREEAGFLND